jgi:hypothetical protein
VILASEQFCPLEISIVRIILPTITKGNILPIGNMPLVYLAATKNKLDKKVK